MSTATDTPNFEAWNQKTLADFAKDAYLKMQEQSEQLAQLQRDLADLRVGYRTMVLRTDDDGR